MTNSKAPWLTRGGAIALMAAAAIALAACSGGGGLNEDEAAGLRGELEAAQLQATADAAARVTAVAEAALAQTEKETAEAEAKVARTDQEAAETALRLAKETAAEQVSDAEADVETARKAAKDALEAKADADAALIEARAKQKEAEVERDAAVRAEATARQQLQAEQQVATTEKQRRIDAEAKQDRLEQENEEAQRQLDQEQAMTALAGLTARASAADTGDPMITPSYRARSTLSTTRQVTWGTPTTSSSGKWFVEKYSHNGASEKNELVIYSDVAAPSNELMRSHPTYSEDFDSTTGEPLEAGITLSTATHATLVKGSGFPSIATGRNNFTVNFDPNDPKTPDNDSDDIVRISGSLQGASGYLHCTPGGDGCTVKNRGDNTYDLEDGNWIFHPRNKDVRVSVPDATYMYFGWWKRMTVPAGELSYRTFVGGAGAVDPTVFNAERGSATYRGPAIGQYALSHTLLDESSSGDFTARAELQANFTDNRISGTITNFSNASDWSLTLNDESMEDGTIAGGTVDWTIGTNKKSGGTWSGGFFSNDPDYSGGHPEGLRGQFTANFDADGRIIGVFGAHRR